MDTIAQGQGTITKTRVDDYLLTWVDAFLIDRKSRGTAWGTLRFYKRCMRLLMRFCDTQAITQITQLTPNDIRQFILWLESTGHNPGGVLK